MDRLSDEQFAALAELLQLRDGAAAYAARLVMVDGLSQVAAAVQTGISAQSVSNAVQRVRRGIDLARRAVA